MQIVVKVPDDMIKSIEQGSFGAKYNIYDIVGCLMNGTSLPEGAEILTKEAYSDLCTRAADVPDTNVGELISRQAAEEKLKKVVDEMALIFADIREKNVDDSVCGLCEYDCDHGIDGCANECPGFERDDCFKLKEEYQKEWTDLSDIPSVEHERETGKWIGEQPWCLPKCSICGASCFGVHGFDAIKTPYCPTCGAKMEEVEE